MKSDFDYRMCQICINCNRWFNNPSIKCDYCGFDNSEFVEFYTLCHFLDKNFPSSKYLYQLIDARKIELNYGWSPYILALLSAIVLGFLTSSSQEKISDWIFSKGKEYVSLQIGNAFDFYRIVEILLNYVNDNREIIEDFSFESDMAEKEFMSYLEILTDTIETGSGNDEYK